MGAQGGVPGPADYLALGDFNVICSMCGKKMKASQAVRNWQGMYRHPWHNEPRQPQDFVRNVKDITTVPFSQPPTQKFLPFAPTFPLSIVPGPISLVLGTADIRLEQSPDILLTQTGDDITVELAYLGTVVADIAPWINPVSILWSWLSGGAGIFINSPTEVATLLQSLTNTTFGVLQVKVVSDMGTVAVATTNVFG